MALPKNPKFDLKLHYNRILEVGLVLTLLMIIAAFRFFPKFDKQEIIAEIEKEYIKMEDIAITRQDKPVIPPKPITPVLAVNDNFDDPVLPPVDLGPEVPGLPAPLPPKKDVVDEPVPDFIPVAEEMPVPVGGLAEIQKKIVYPYIAIKAQIEGRVIVKAYVDENGNVVKTELLKGIGAGCDEAARLAVEQTKFAPGKQRGRPVKVQVAVPVLFKLQ